MSMQLIIDIINKLRANRIVHKTIKVIQNSNCKIRSRRICPTQSVTHRQTTDKQKGPMLSHEAFSFI